MVKISHVALRMRVVALAGEGRTDAAIAEVLGLSRASVSAFRHEAKLLQDRAAAAKSAKPRLLRKQRTIPGGIEIPAWVIKASLGQDFSDVARERGEHAAASHCRALLREMRASA